MCILCSQVWVEDHWSDAAPDGDVDDLVVLESHAVQRGKRLRDRASRARYFSLVLASRGLTLQDWEGSSFILRDAKGNAAVVPNLAAVWAAAATMLGEALDPLDPTLIQAIQARLTSGKR